MLCRPALAAVTRDALSVKQANPAEGSPGTRGTGPERNVITVHPDAKPF